MMPKQHTLTFQSSNTLELVCYSLKVWAQDFNAKVPKKMTLIIVVKNQFFFPWVEHTHTNRQWNENKSFSQIVAQWWPHWEDRAIEMVIENLTFRMNGMNGINRKRMFLSKKSRCLCVRVSILIQINVKWLAGRVKQMNNQNKLESPKCFQESKRNDVNLFCLHVLCSNCGERNKNRWKQRSSVAWNYVGNASFHTFIERH